MPDQQPNDWVPAQDPGDWVPLQQGPEPASVAPTTPYDALKARVKAGGAAPYTDGQSPYDLLKAKMAQAPAVTMAGSPNGGWLADLKAKFSQPGETSPSAQPDSHDVMQFKGSPSGPDSSIWDDLVKQWSNPDVEAKAMMKSLGFAAGAVADTAMEAGHRLTSGGTKGLPEGEWTKALHGEAAFPPETLQKMGMGTGLSYALGVPLAIGSDPLGGFIGAAGKVAKPMGLWNLLKQMPAAGSKNIQPIGQMLQALGKKVYSAPFKAADADIVDGFKGALARYGEKPASNLFWNAGEPEIGGFSKTNAQIGEQVDAGKQAAWNSMQETLNEADKPTGAAAESVLKDPRLTDPGVMRDPVKLAQIVRTKQGAEELAAHLNASDDLEGPAGLKTLESIKAGLPDKSVITPGAPINLAPDLPMHAQIEQMKEASAAGESLGDKAPHWTDWLMQKLASPDKAARGKAIKILADSAPDLANVINKNESKLGNAHDRDAILSSYEKMIWDLAQGDRDINGLHGMQSAWSKAASGNRPMGQNVYARGADKYSLGKLTDAAFGKAMSDSLSNIIEQRLGENGWTNQKKTYAIFAKAQNPVWATIEASDKRPWFSKLDTLGTMLGLATHNPGAVAAVAGSKTGQEVGRNIRFGTGMGMMLNNAGRSSLPDNIVRRLLINSALTPDTGDGQ